MKHTTSLIAALVVAMGATSAMAQSPAGAPSDPTTNENQQPGPSVANPTDPAAGANPSARIPTSPPGTVSGKLLKPSGDGASSGDTGMSSPAGNPADPNTDENQQMGPSGKNPADPAAGANPSARVPTDSSNR